MGQVRQKGTLQLPYQTRLNFIILKGTLRLSPQKELFFYHPKKDFTNIIQEGTLWLSSQNGLPLLCFAYFSESLFNLSIFYLRDLEVMAGQYKASNNKCLVSHLHPHLFQGLRKTIRLARKRRFAAFSQFLKHLSRHIRSGSCNLASKVVLMFAHRQFAGN